MRTKTYFGWITGVSVLMIGLAPWSAAYAKSPINATFFGNLAIKGYDPVAYFTEGKALEGKKDFEFEWMGAKWRFASEGNLTRFKEDPEGYAPRYGGYCAYAVALGKTADVDPGQWKIVDGRLYLNYDREIQEKWLKDLGGYIRKADANWPGVLE